MVTSRRRSGALAAWLAGVALGASMTDPATCSGGMAAAAETATPAGPPASPAEPTAAPAARVEARSADLLAVGTVRGPRMIIHVSRIADNAPVRDARVAVVLRGETRPTTAEADGSYSLSAPELTVPGAAAVLFDVTAGALHEQLAGNLEVADPAGAASDKNSSRQIGWWVLNFAVCIGFLLLWNRRRSRSASAEGGAE